MHPEMRLTAKFKADASHLCFCQGKNSIGMHACGSTARKPLVAPGNAYPFAFGSALRQPPLSAVVKPLYRPSRRAVAFLVGGACPSLCGGFCGPATSGTASPPLRHTHKLQGQDKATSCPLQFVRFAVFRPRFPRKTSAVLCPAFLPRSSRGGAVGSLCSPPWWRYTPRPVLTVAVGNA